MWFWLTWVCLDSIINWSFLGCFRNVKFKNNRKCTISPLTLERHLCLMPQEVESVVDVVNTIIIIIIITWKLNNFYIFPVYILYLQYTKCLLLQISRHILVQFKEQTLKADSRKVSMISISGRDWKVGDPWGRGYAEKYCIPLNIRVQIISRFLDTNIFTPLWIRWL